jgi:GNAT superfamily N-acetyltransferase
MPPSAARFVVISYRSDHSGVDWAGLVDDLTADDFHNGRTPAELRESFSASFAAVYAFDGARVVGTARLLSDGVCNAYLVDVWTMTPYRRQGIGAAMVHQLLDRVPGQHIGLFTDRHADFYSSLGFRPAEGGMKIVVGTWLNRS